MLSVLINLLTQKNYAIFERPFELNIVGVRNPNRITNNFDDAIHVFYKNTNKEWQLHSYNATTDPGNYWLKHLLNTKGCAVLKPNQYINCYAIGLHRGKYRALVQQLPVTVYRDANTNNSIDMLKGTEDTGLFGINIHHAANVGITNEVNKYSAGCQVFAAVKDFESFMLLAEKHKKLYGNQFTYTLLQ